jgi:WD40 repeat protein
MSGRLFQNIVFAVVSATLIADQTARAKDLLAHRLTTNTPELAVQAVALSPDGKSIRTLTADRELFVDESGNSSLLWSQPGSASEIWGVPSPDGKYLALVLAPHDANVFMVDDF